MSIAIKAENLGKKYAISHEKKQRHHCNTLQESLTSMGKHLWRRCQHPLSQTSDAFDIEEFWALKDVSFNIKQGERVGIIGRNGAGKSTLLKILSRITSPTTGKVTIKGRVSSLLEVGTGFHPELTGRENIFLNGAILGMNKEEIKRKFDEIVSFAEVEKFLDTPVKRYSSGMYVRLAFGVAAHLEPEILIVDEVLAVGDLTFQNKCLSRMTEIGQSGRTVLFVSHNLNAVKQLCDRAILIENGSLRLEGTSDTVVESYVSSVAIHLAPSKEYEKNKDKVTAEIRAVSVTNEGATVDRVDLKDEIFVHMEYELYRDLTGISVGLQIIDIPSGQTILSSPDPELDVSRLGLRKQGLYRAIVRIPGNLLNTSTYTVKVGISDRYRIYDCIEDVVFEVVDRAGIVNIFGRKRKNSILSTQLIWDLYRLS